MKLSSLKIVQSVLIAGAAVLGSEICAQHPAFITEIREDAHTTGVLAIKVDESVHDIDYCTATASSTAEERFSPMNVLDGDGSTSWKPTDSKKPQELIIDYRRPFSIHSVGIVFGYGEWGADRYSIQISNDQKTWTTIAIATEEMCIAQEYGHTRGFNRSPEFLFDTPHTARYLRLSLEKSRAKRNNRKDWNDPGTPYDSFMVAEVFVNGGANVSTYPVPADAPFRNAKLDAAERAKDLISRMTFTEKLSLVNGFEIFYYAGLPRFGLRPVYFQDTTSGLKQRGHKENKSNMGYLDETTCFPAATLLAATFDRDLVYENGRKIGEEALADGCDVLLGPGMNIHRTAECGRNWEYFSEDPFLSAQTGVAYINGLQSMGIVATAKHLVANNFELDRNDVSSDMDERTLFEIYLPSFEAASKEAKVKAIMTGYNWLNGNKLGEDPYIMNEVMRKKFGYEGMFMSDWFGNDDNNKILGSGQNICMPASNSLPNTIRKRYQKDPKGTERALNLMIFPPLRTFFTQGIYDRPRGNSEYVKTVKEHGAFVRTAAAQGITLLKNEGGLLPLKNDAKILITGDKHAYRFQIGRGSGEVKGWNTLPRHEIYKKVFPNVNFNSYKDLKAKERAGDEYFPTDKEIKEAEAVIFTFSRDDSEGRDSPFEYPDNDEAIRRLTSLNKNVIVLISGGGGVSMPWKDEVKAILHCYYGGQEAEWAIGDILSGKVNPSGKLPFTMEQDIKDSCAYGFNIFDGITYGKNNDEKGFKDMLQKKFGKTKGWPSEYKEGIFVGYRWYDKYNKPIHYPFGYGLSYTTFSISNIQAPSVFVPGKPYTVSVKVSNTGKIAGAEVVQLYVQDLRCSVPRPVRELKGYEKVFLKPGESKVLTLKLNDRSFAFYDQVEKHDWVVEAGKFMVSVGNSSRDTQQTLEVTVN